jgi:hypothetical protein
MVALAIGVIVAAVLAWGAQFAHRAHSAAYLLFWQNTLLQSVVPLHNIGTPERPIYEGTPLNILAYLASYPLGAVVYAAAVYAVLCRRTKQS